MLITNQVKQASSTKTSKRKNKTGSALGTTTKLGDKKGYEPAKNLDSLRRVFLKNTQKGIRDKYTLSDTSTYVLDIYEHNQSRFDYLLPPSKRNKKVSFNRQHFCHHILENISVAKLTQESYSLINTNIAKCGNVWTCPDCSALIQSRRADEVKKFISYAESHGYKVIMLTLTASHNASYRLYDFLKRLQMAYRKMMDTTKRHRNELGRIKALEFKYSYRNGWHPHYHILIAVPVSVDVKSYKTEVLDAWTTACIKNGLLDASDSKATVNFYAHAVNITADSPARTLEKYMTKFGNDWCAAQELTLSNSKISADDAGKGRGNEHYTPFQLLINVLVRDADSPYYYNSDIEAYIEYAIVSKGRHQLDWSNGLKAVVGIVDKSDTELAEEEAEKAITLFGLTVKHWHILRSKHLLANYKKAYADGGVDGVADFFRAIDTALPALLTVAECDLYESEDESPERDALLKRLDDIADNTPRTYKSGRYNKHTEAMLTEEERQTVVESREAVRRLHDADDFDFWGTDSSATKPAKSVEQIRTDWIANHQFKPKQTTLFNFD